MAKKRVCKALIVGLGSNGTEICDELAERIRWELGSLDNSPWVKFLAIETDQNKSHPNLDEADFFTLSVSSHDYQAMLSMPEGLDQSINFSKWADVDTLRKLPNQEVSQGAGNIRMVGRVALMHSPNFKQIFNQINSRVQELHSLSEAAASNAMEKGGLAKSEIEFHDNGKIRIYVAGSLCGGTCSGLISDIGFLLRRFCKDGEKVSGYVTLPRPELSEAVEPLAQRLKKNAYTALTELNHYFLLEPDDPPILWPDEHAVQPGTLCYDQFVLTMPAGQYKEDLQKLNSAIADVLFLNVFATSTDPSAKLADSQASSDDGIARRFSTIGVSSLEFPAPRIIDACAVKLSKWALDKWVNNGFSGDPATLLDKLGFNWVQVKDYLTQNEVGENLEEQIQRRIDDCVQIALTNPSGAGREIRKLRDSFRDASGETSLSIYKCIQTNSGNLRSYCQEQVRAELRTWLTDLSMGPTVAREAIKAAREVFASYNDQDVSSPDTGKVDQIISELESLESNRVYKLFGLKREALAERKADLHKALREECEQRLTYSLLSSLKSINMGVLQQELQSVEDRLRGLIRRIHRLSSKQLKDRYEELAGQKPKVNGVILFEPEISGEGTVIKEFQRCLAREQFAGPGKDYAVGQERVAKELIRQWVNDIRLEEDLFADEDSDYLSESDLDLADLPVKREDYRLLVRIARMSFETIAATSVLARWSKQGGKEQRAEIARDFARQAIPFLSIQTALAKLGGKNPPAEQQSLVRPDESSVEEEFEQIVRLVQPKIDISESPEKFRSVMIEHVMNFPLTAVPDIVGSNGLASSHSNDFPIFHSRRDISWRVVQSDLSEKQRKIAQKIAIAFLLGDMYLSRSELVFVMKVASLGIQEREVFFPLSVNRAATMVDLGSDKRHNNVKDMGQALDLTIKERIDTDGAAKFVAELDEAASLKRHYQISDPRALERYAMEYLIDYEDNELLKAFIRHKGISDEKKRDLFRMKGQEIGDKGALAPKDGYYSYKGGFIGSSEEESYDECWTCLEYQEYCGPLLGG